MMRGCNKIFSERNSDKEFKTNKRKKKEGNSMLLSERITCFDKS